METIDTKLSEHQKILDRISMKMIRHDSTLEILSTKWVGMPWGSDDSPEGLESYSELKEGRHPIPNRDTARVDSPDPDCGDANDAERVSPPKRKPRRRRSPNPPSDSSSSDSSSESSEGNRRRSNRNNRRPNRRRTIFDTAADTLDRTQNNLIMYQKQPSYDHIKLVKIGAFAAMDFVESAIEYQRKWKIELPLPVLVSTSARSLIISKNQTRYKKKYRRPLDEAEFLDLDQATFLECLRFAAKPLNVTQFQQLLQFVKFELP